MAIEDWREGTSLGQEEVDAIACRVNIGMWANTASDAEIGDGVPFVGVVIRYTKRGEDEVTEGETPVLVFPVELMQQFAAVIAETLAATKPEPLLSGVVQEVGDVLSRMLQNDETAAVNVNGWLSSGNSAMYFGAICAMVNAMIDVAAQEASVAPELWIKAMVAGWQRSLASSGN